MQGFAGDSTRGRPAPGVAAYAVYAAPIVASGEATFAGYVKLDDTATLLGMLDYALERGTHVTGLAPSSYEAMLTFLLGDGYPLGSFLPLGVTRLVDVDPAWTWQPYLAFLARASRARPLRARRQRRTLARGSVRSSP